MLNVHHVAKFRTVSARLVTIAALLMALAAHYPAAAQAQSARRECIATDTGAPLKLIVRTDTVLCAEPTDATPIRPAQVFEWYYALPADDAGARTANGWYRAGTAPGLDAEAGWLKAEHVLEWSHRQVVGFRAFAGRSRHVFFASPEDLKKAHADPAIADGLAISREPETPTNMLMPLFEARRDSVADERVDLYRVAYLHGGARAKASTAEPSPGGVTAERLRKEFSADVVFVIDTTASMHSFIESVKQVVARVVESVQKDPKLASRIRFGLVAYRDQIRDQARIEYRVKLVSDLATGADHEEFKRRLREVREAGVSSEDVPEDVLAGLHTAIREAGWNPVGLKSIVLIGDASAQTDSAGYKNPDRLSIEGVLAEAQPTGQNAAFERITIHGLRVIGDEPGDHERCREHFEAITRGRELPGLHYEYRLGAGEGRFVENLVEVLGTMVQGASMVAGNQAEQLQQQVQAAPSGSVQERVLGPVLEMLRSAGEPLGPATDAPAFASGWGAATDPDGNQALEAQVMVTRGSLGLFQSALDFTLRVLEDARQPGTLDVQRVVQQLQMLATQVNMGEPIEPDMPLEQLLSLILGFPVKNAIFAMSPNRLAAMTDGDFQAWLGQVRGVRDVMQAHLDNGAIWFALDPRTARDQDRIAFVKVADLP